MTPAAAAAPASVLVCAGCGAAPDPDDPYPFRCPNAGRDDDIDHVLRRVLDPGAVRFPTGPDAQGEPNPFLRYRPLFHSHHLAVARGMPDAEYAELVAGLDAEVARVDGRGFTVTPFARADGLSARLGFAEGGGVWIKDETGNVSGSHKARHLFGLLVHLEVVERLGLADPRARPPLAIASCGNAALAAAVVAAAGRRELEVFVPVDADPAVLGRLRDLGAHVTTCPRDPAVPGDPTYRRLREAIADRAIPFTCQGNENGLAIEGGITLGYELASDVARGPGIDRLVVQVGGGALASACLQGLAEAAALGVLPASPRVDTVQTLGAWPLRRAFDRVAARVPQGAGSDDVRAAVRVAATHRSRFMWPWESEPRSVAHGILDDETYDWVAVVEGMLATGGRPLVVDEGTLVEANRVGVAATGIDADHTGTSGLAGLLELLNRGEIGIGERVAVLFTGVRRSKDDRRIEG